MNYQASAPPYVGNGVGQDFSHHYANHDYYEGGVNEGSEYDQAGDTIHIQEGVWAPQMSTMMGDGITCLEYDQTYERLWVGSKTGRVTSMKFDPSEMSDSVEATPYCSFLTSYDAVNELHPVGDCILSTSAYEIRMHSVGGLPIARLRAPEVIEAGGVSASALFTCSAIACPGGGSDATHLLAGTKRNLAMAFDLSTFSNPMLTVDIGAGAVCCRENGFYSSIACDDGKVRLLDPRLRSNRVLHALEAHSGPCMDTFLSPTDSLLYTCGKTKKLLNPYDPASPVKYSYDPLVKVFDLRTNRQLAPLRMTAGTPYFLRFVPASPSQGGYGAQILFASGNGAVQVFDPNGNGSDAQMLYSPLASQRDSLTDVAVSSSGKLFVTGSYSGCLTQFAVGLSFEKEQRHVINSQSEHLPSPPLEAPAPAVSLDVLNSQVLASAYVLHQRDSAEELTSSFSSTPRLMNDRFKLTSSRLVSPGLLRNAHMNDFIGTVENPGFELNSMLYTSAVNGVRAYAVSDPRNVDTTELGITPSKTHVTQKETAAPPERPNILPMKYRKQHSYRGKKRMNKFNYASLNNTSCMGLENSAPNSYTNTILQLLYAIPEIRAIALSAQASTYHHQNPHTLWGELGFLFHMIRSVQKSYESDDNDDYGRVVTPSNFQRTYQCIPEAVALGLFDGSKVDSQSLVQTFTRFLLQQLHQEADLESRHQSDGSSRRNPSRSFSAVDDIYGFTVISKTKFLISNKTEVGSPNRAFALDIVYPSTKYARKEVPEIDLENLTEAQQLPRGHPSSFSNAIWGSLRKETSMRGWCKSSEAYEPFKQVRSMINLPRVLTLLCGDTQKDPNASTISGALGEIECFGSMHTHYWSSTIAGCTWLPTKLEIAMLRQGADATSQAKLIVSALLVPGSDCPRKDVETWVIYDGTKDCVAPKPASLIPSYGIVIKPAAPAPVVDLNKPYNPNPQPIVQEAKADEWELVELNLVAVVSQVQSEIEPSDPGRSVEEHAVLHMKRDPHTLAKEAEHPESEWILFNDFNIQYTDAHDTVSFPAWRHPCAIFFSRADYIFGAGPIDTCTANSSVPLTQIPTSVLSLPSQSSVPCIRIGAGAVPGKGELIAFDAEFVSVELERAEVNAEGQRVTVSEARQNVARISLVNGGPRHLQEDSKEPPVELLADDYIIPSETTLDFLTRFSGIVAEDLQPGVSRHAVVHNRTAYLKLRLFVDRGCIFVGHGLSTDFETANIFVPKEQILDTVELWRLPGQRKLSLRFLALYFLKQDIQDEVHDSIEDAKTALQLYRHYEKVVNQGHAHLQSVLQELYAYGQRTNWTVTDDIIQN